MASKQELSEIKFLKVPEIAEILRLSRMTVYRLVHSGELPAVKMGSAYRVSERAVYDYLLKNDMQTRDGE